MKPRGRWALHVATALAGAACAAGAGGSAAAVREETPGAFDAVTLQAPVEVTIRRGPRAQVRIEADEKTLAALRASVQGSTLRIEAVASFSARGPVRIDVVSPRALSRLEAGSSGGITLDATDAPRFESRAGDSATIEVAAVTSSEVRVDAQEGGTVRLRGRTGQARLQASDSATIDCGGLDSAKASVEASGSANVSVRASQSLRGSARDAATIQHSGAAKSAITIDDAASVDGK